MINIAWKIKSDIIYLVNWLSVKQTLIVWFDSFLRNIKVIHEMNNNISAFQIISNNEIAR